MATYLLVLRLAQRAIVEENFGNVALPKLRGSGRTHHTRPDRRGRVETVVVDVEVVSGRRTRSFEVVQEHGRGLFSQSVPADEIVAPRIIGRRTKRIVVFVRGKHPETPAIEVQPHPFVPVGAVREEIGRSGGGIVVFGHHQHRRVGVAIEFGSLQVVVRPVETEGFAAVDGVVDYRRLLIRITLGGVETVTRLVTPSPDATPVG